MKRATRSCDRSITYTRTTRVASIAQAAIRTLPLCQQSIIVIRQSPGQVAMRVVVFESVARHDLDATSDHRPYGHASTVTILAVGTTAVGRAVRPFDATRFDVACSTVVTQFQSLIDATSASFARIVAVSLSASANCSSSFALQRRKPLGERHVVILNIRRADIASRRQHMVVAPDLLQLRRLAEARHVLVALALARQA